MFDGTRTLWERLLGRTMFASNDAPYVIGEFYVNFLERNPVSTTSQVMVPAVVLHKVGPSCETLSVASDYELYLRIARRYPIAFINEVLTRWRYLETSVSGRADLRMVRWSDAMLVALRIHAPEAPASVQPLIQRRIAELERDVAWSAYQLGCHGERRLARRFLWHLVTRGRVRPAAYYIAVSLPARMRRAAQHTMDRLRSMPPASSHWCHRRLHCSRGKRCRHH
jgi:hypothetical protein